MRFQLMVFCATLCTCLCVGNLFAVDVDRSELETSVTDTINFVNFTGEQSGNISTADEIRAIGRQLSLTLRPGESVLYANRYRITHLPPNAPGERGADIFELLPNARVDHIDNVRRILSAYLESRYAYSSEDARILGELVTIYNAVYRGNRGFFADRYIEAVSSLLTEDSVGLSLLYTEWPGASQIVIPISSDAAAGELSSVPASELLDEPVEELLRASEDLGLEERIEAVDLIDRTIDEERSQAEEAQANIDTQREELESEEAEIRENIASAETADQAAEQEALLAANQEAQEELDQQEQTISEQEEEIAEADSRSDEIRESIASDIASLSGERAEAAPLIIPRSRISGEQYYSTIARIDSESSAVLLTSEEEIIGRDFVETETALIAIGEAFGSPRLLLFNAGDLSLVGASEQEVSRYSSVLNAPDGFVYAVIRVDNGWFIGRFEIDVDASADEGSAGTDSTSTSNPLRLRAQSSIAVSEGSALIIFEEKLYVQREDGRFTSLDLVELSVSR